MATIPVFGKVMKAVENIGGNVRRMITPRAVGVVMQSPQLDILDLIAVQRGQIKRREFTPLGRLERIDLGENHTVSHAPDSLLIRSADNPHPMAPALDWTRYGPLLCTSKDGQDLLVATRCVHPPDLVDPNWMMPAGPYKIIDGIPQYPEPRKVRQSLIHRCFVGEGAQWVRQPDGRWKPSGEWCVCGDKGEQWLMFMPITQITFSFLNGSGMGLVNCGADVHGRHATFVYDRKSEEGFILFGKKKYEYYQ